MNKAEILLEKSINNRLCCHCGVCAGVCPVNAITTKNNIINVNIEKCVNCNLCVECCPAGGYELSDLTLEDVQEIPQYSIASKNKEVFENASSGGFVTQSLLLLLENKKITSAAVVLAGDNIDDSLAKYVITNDPETIMKARRSKYTQATIDGVIEYIKNNDGRYAIVGLPCQLYGITMAMKKNPILQKRIVYKFGMVCGYTYDEECINGLLKVMNLDRSSVKKVIGWREGGLPGNFAVELKDDSIRSLPFIDEHSVDVTYFAQHRCRVCRDCLCEYGDIVSADIGGWKERRTLVLVRNNMGRKLLEYLSKYDDLDIKKSDIPLNKTVIPFMLRSKRSLVDYRGKKIKSNKPVWIGGYSPKLTISQKLESLLKYRYEKIAIKNKKSHSSKKMLVIGHKTYHKIASLFVFKVLFKIQYYTEKISKKINIKTYSIYNKIKIILGTRGFWKKRDSINVGIIGLGRWGAQYLKFLNNTRNYRIVAAYDTDDEKLQSLSKKFNFIAANSIEDLCENYGVEAIFILTSTPTHHDIYAKTVKYGMPTYIEKPISLDLVSAENMYEMSVEQNSILYVAHSMKFEPVIQKIKSILQNNTLGKIQSFSITRSVKNRMLDYFDNVALYQIGVHLIDVVLYLFGEFNSVIVRNDVSEQQNYEYASFIVADDIKGCLKYGFSSDYNFNLKITGEKGILTYAEQDLNIYTESGVTKFKIPMKNEKTIYDQLNEFYVAVKEDKAYLNTAQNAVEVIKTCDKIIKKGENS